MTRQNYYARRKLRRRRAVDGELVAQLVQRERCLQPRLGARKMRVLLRDPLAEAGVQLGRDRFFEVLREHDLLLAGVLSGRRQPNRIIDCRCSGIWSKAARSAVPMKFGWGI
jgi:hypothetical protein